MSSRLQLVRVKFFFSIFFNFLAELYHFKTFVEKKFFSKNFQKTLFGNFDPEGGLESFWSINRKLFSVKNPCGKVVSDLRYLQKCGLQELNSIFWGFFANWGKMPGGGVGGGTKIPFLGDCPNLIKYFFFKITSSVQS